MSTQNTSASDTREQQFAERAARIGWYEAVYEGVGEAAPTDDQQAYYDAVAATHLFAY